MRVWVTKERNEKKKKNDAVVGWSDGLCEIWQESLASMMAMEWALLFGGLDGSFGIAVYEKRARFN